MSVIPSSSSSSSTSALLRSSSSILVDPPLDEQKIEKKEEKNDTPKQQQIFTPSSQSSSKTTTTQQQQQSNNDHQTTNTTTTSTSPSSVVVRRRPAVPPKPQIDIVRFSMAQARDEVDLDTILTELLQLEEQLSGEAGDRFVLGLPKLPEKPTTTIQAAKTETSEAAQLSVQQQQPRRVQFQQFNINENSTTNEKLTSNDCRINSESSRFNLSSAKTNGLDITDCDSAFGDSSSTESASHVNHSNGAALLPNGNCTNSEFSSADSFRGSLDTPSPTRQFISSECSFIRSNVGGERREKQLLPYTIGGVQQQQPLSRPPSSTESYISTITTNNKDEIKKAKIREALEKMKEAKMKKIFVKIFLEDGTQRGILLDERWTVADTMFHLAEKINCLLTPEHVILEHYPKLFIKRIYEDNEFVVENLEEWGEDSPNELHFVKLPNKWSLFYSPQKFLLTERNKNEFPSFDNQNEWNIIQKQKLLNSYIGDETLGSTNIGRVPELEGWLLLKLDGKKTWKRHYFVLRASGLYYVSKPGKTRGPTRDLQCLMSVFNNQVYICTDWNKKYKSPTNWGFAIKHPRIQSKSSKFIKYICAEDEQSFNQWINALRIVKNGFSSLYKSFCSSLERFNHQNSSVRVELPQVVHQLQNLSIDSPSTRKRLLNVSTPRSTTPIIFGTPATLRSSSNAFNSTMPSLNCSDSRFGSPTMQNSRIAFEQDFCNTIKRQPEHQQQQQNVHLQPSKNLISAFIENSFEISSNRNNLRLEENDSDEADIFPLPPQQPSSLPTTPNRCQQSIINNSFIQQSPSSPLKFNKNLNKILPPPPPPKRSEGTRLQSIPISLSSSSNNSSLNNAIIRQSSLKMDMLTELTLATNKQKIRLENNISNNSNNFNESEQILNS